MPIYTYRCENCGVQFERRQKYSDDPLKSCPECSQETLRKVYLPVGIVFKGSGFYATDNRSSSRTKTASAKNGSEKKESGGEGEKSSSGEEKKTKPEIDKPDKTDKSK